MNRQATLAPALQPSTRSRTRSAPAGPALRKPSWALAASLGAACLLSVPGLVPMAAHAGIVVVSSTVPAASSPHGGNAAQAVWQYRLSLVRAEPASLKPSGEPRPGDIPANALLHPGAIFGLGNFGGYVPGSCTSPEGWVCSARLPGLDPATVWAADLVDAAPADGTVDLFWTYVSGPMQSGSPGGVPLGLFTASSWHTGTAMLDWTSQGGPPHANGMPWKGDGQVAGAQAGRGDDVPEPASVALAGLALVLAAGTTQLALPRRRRCAQHRLR